MSEILGPVGLVLQSKLTEALQPTMLQVIDESHQHHGHSGAHPLGESHFRIKISSESFIGLTRVAQHRLINGVLAQDLRERVHALAIEVI